MFSFFIAFFGPIIWALSWGLGRGSTPLPHLASTSFLKRIRGSKSNPGGDTSTFWNSLKEPFVPQTVIVTIIFANQKLENYSNSSDGRMKTPSIYPIDRIKKMLARKVSLCRRSFLQTTSLSHRGWMTVLDSIDSVDYDVLINNIGQPLTDIFGQNDDNKNAGLLLTI